MTADYADYNAPAAQALAISQVDLTGTGLAKDTSVGGVNLTLSAGTNKLLDGTTAGPLTDTRDHTLTTANNVASQTSGGTIANEVASTGVPLLSRPVNLLNDANHNIPFGSTVTIATGLIVTQPGYEIAVTALISASAPTLPILTVSLTWSDSVTGTTVAHETWNVPIGSTSGGSVHIGTGPTKGNRLTIKLTNNDSAQAATVTTVVNQNSRIYQRDDWRTESFNAIPNGTLPAHDQQGNQLASLLTSSLGALGSQTRLMALYAGRITVTFGSTVSKTGSLQINQLDPAQPNGVFALLSIPGNNFTQVVTLSLPRAVCEFTLADTSNTSGNILQAFFIVDEFLP